MFNVFSMFQYLLPEQQILACQLDAGLLRQVRMRLSANKVKIESLTTEPVKPLDIPLKTSLVTTTVFASSKTLARVLEIALTKPKDVDAAFLFEAENELPYPIESIIVDKIRLGTTNGSTELQLFCANKCDLEAQIASLKELNFDPEIICPKPLALCHFVQQFVPDPGPHIVIDIDREETTCLLVQNGLPLMSRSHPTGLLKLETITTQDEEGALSINEALLPFLHQYLREISRILLTFQNGRETGPDEEPKPIFFTGPVVENQILVDLITGALNRQAFQSNIDPQYVSYASTIGCALSTKHLAQSTSINFRQNEFAFCDQWRHWKKELVAYFCLMIGIAAGFFTIGKATLAEQHVGLTEKYATLLSIMEKPIVEQELIALSSNELDDKLYSLEKELKTNPEEMALHPDVPRVTDLLAWLSSHPNVVIGGEDRKSLTLENLTYTMVKRPEKGKTKEHYQVRVELEFSAPSATMAREFHDALLAPNAFVDPKNELKWSVQRGRFRASFFLKDRTKYPHMIVEGSSV